MDKQIFTKIIITISGFPIFSTNLRYEAIDDVELLASYWF